MAAHIEPNIDEYLRKRLMPVEGAIPHLDGIDMYGNSIPASTVGGDIFEYINFQQRYNIDARIARALKQSKDFLVPLPEGQTPRNYSGFACAVAEVPAGLRACHGRRVQMGEELRTAENR